MPWRDPNHPIWPTIRTILILLSLIVILWMNAAHFDETEIRSIIGMFFALIGAEGVTHALKRKE